MTNPVYITSLGTYLPNNAIGNDEIEDYLGYVGGKPSKFKDRILRSNGISSRHLALDRDGNATHLNQTLATNAIKNALKKRGMNASELDMLAAGTTIPDTIMPGFASMIHGELGGHRMDVLSAAGVCCSSMAAMKSAWHAIQAGEHQRAIAVGSERSSGMMTARNFEKESEISLERDETDPSYKYFNADFLRWMLSDGDGAAILEDQPRPEGLSLRIDWIKLNSYAHTYPTCMYMGMSAPSAPVPGTTWTSLPEGKDPLSEGMLLVRQDVKLLNEKICAAIAHDLKNHIDAGHINMDEVDHFLPHFSSYYFYEKLMQAYIDAGINIPAEKWYTNLQSRGNTGSASIYIMLDEAVETGRIQEGDKVLLMVPESGRFSFCYALLTCTSSARENCHISTEIAGISYNSVAPHANTGLNTAAEIEQALYNSPLGYQFYESENPVTRWLATELAFVWDNFQKRLKQVPLMRKLEAGTITRDDYKTWLVNLRQQVVDGGLWISRAASNMSMDLFELRTALISHASEEHRDYLMLEKDFLNMGGTQKELESRSKNIGSEALSAYIFHRANQPDPVDLLGGIFIIEGLGSVNTGIWCSQLRESLALEDNQIRFFLAHYDHDQDHYATLRHLLSQSYITYNSAREIVKTARVIARLYALQLEELDNC